MSWSSIYLVGDLAVLGLFLLTDYALCFTGVAELPLLFVVAEVFLENLLLSITLVLTFL